MRRGSNEILRRPAWGRRLANRSRGTVGSAPQGVAVSPTGADAGDVYVTNLGSNTVSVIPPG